MILFETTESVIEVLWDIALAFFVVRLALLYAVLTFGSVLTVELLLHRLPPTSALSVAAPDKGRLLLPFLLLTVSTIWARFLVAHFQVPRNVPFRLAVGVTAAALGMIGESLVRLVLYEGGWWSVGEWMRVGWKVWAPMMMAFAVMPAVQMAFEKGWEAVEEEVEELRHRHAKKSIRNAV
jgi:hypothetical protein